MGILCKYAFLCERRGMIVKWFLVDLGDNIGEERFQDVALETKELFGYPVASSDIRTFSAVMGKDRKVTVRAAGEITILMPCDRCLSDTAVRLEFSEEQVLDPERSVDENGDPVFCFVENALDTDEFLSETIRPYLPMQVLCDPDCKGLCPVCGQNLNKGSCACHGSAAPTRMAEALKKAFMNSDSDIKIE